jgi:hypothetical protein
MQQTAVEWLKNQVEKEDGVLTKGFILILLEQAKAMEKEQIVDTFQDSRILSVTNNCSSGNQYYKDTYESKEM